MGFTRKEAEHLLALPESMLEKLGLITDKSIINHYAKGGDVEVASGVNMSGRTYSIVTKPSFERSGDWRKDEPPEIEIFGVKVQCNPPMSEEPEPQSKYWFIDPSRHIGYDCGYWADLTYEKNNLKRGICFEREEDAKKVAQALFEDLQ